nr:zinc knuckle CX2CX4HX4C [Tanacetum cinerariifolium]
MNALAGPSYLLKSFENRTWWFFLLENRMLDQASNWLERLPAGSISTWEDLTTRFLAQFFAWCYTYAYIQDGGLFIAKRCKNPTDSYTSSMCNDSLGRISFARCLIKVNPETDFVDVVTIRIPSLIGDGFTKKTIHVEYEWRPPRCDICKIFGHVHDHCPKKVVSPPIVTTSTVEKSNDGFQMVGKKKKRKGKSKSFNGG